MKISSHLDMEISYVCTVASDYYIWRLAAFPYEKPVIMCVGESALTALRDGGQLAASSLDGAYSA